jgi:hypothetical protein
MTIERITRRGFLATTCLFTLLGAYPAIGEIRSNFVEVRLPRGVALTLPAHWRIIGPNEEQMIQTSSEAALDVSGITLPSGNESVLIAANSMPLSTYAAVRVVSTTPSPIAPSLFSVVTPSLLREMGISMRDMTARILSTQGQALIEFLVPRIDRISGFPAVVTTYRRTGPQGPVFVQVNVIYTTSQQLTVNLSYRESEAGLWKPVIEKVRRSIVVNQ